MNNFENGIQIKSDIKVKYPTGLLGFDYINKSQKYNKTDDKDFDYGITDGSMNMIIGKPCSYKTTCAIQFAVNIIKPYKTSCIYHDDIDHGTNDTRIKQFTDFTDEELETKYFYRNTDITIETFYKRIKMIYDKKTENKEKYKYDTGLKDKFGNKIYKLEPTVYLLDSVNCLIPENCNMKDDLYIAKMIFVLFERIKPMLKSANIILFIINHIGQKININHIQDSKAQASSYFKLEETLYSGNGIIPLSDNIIRFDIKNTNISNDILIIYLSILKSDSDINPNYSVPMVFDNNGINKELSIFSLLKENEIIQGSDQNLYIKDRSDIVFSFETFKEKLNNDNKFYSIIMKVTYNILSKYYEL